MYFSLTNQTQYIENGDPDGINNPVPKFLPEAKMSLGYYIEDYLENLINPNSDFIKEIRKDYFMPPMDVLYSGFNLGSCEPKFVYFWVMRFILSSCYVFSSHRLINEIPENIMPNMEESNLETYEDMYYYTIYVLIKSFSFEKELIIKNSED